MRHALEQQRQPGLPAQPGDVVPGGRVGEQAVEQRALPRRQRPRRARGQTVEMHRTHPRRQSEARAPLAVTGALHRRVDRQHQRRAAGGLGAPHQIEREASVVLEIELEPQRAGVRVGADDAGDVLDRHGRLRAQHHAGLQRRGGLRGGAFAVRMRQPLVSDRRQQDRVRQRAAEQRDPRVRARHRPQHPRRQGNLAPRLHIGGQRQLVRRAALEVGAGVVVQPVAGECGVVGQTDRRGGRAGGVHGASGWLTKPTLVSPAFEASASVCATWRYATAWSARRWISGCTG